MKLPFQKIKQDLNSVRFSIEEKAEVLKSINLYMAENPVERRSFSFNLLMNKNYMIPAIIIALLLATSGGTVAAAENSLPGDMLYGVKLHVNERMMSAIAISDDAEADMQSRFSERRLQEYNQMLNGKRWSVEMEQTLADRLSEYQETTLALIEQLRKEGKNDLADNIYDKMVAKGNSHEEFVMMLKNASPENVETILVERMQEMHLRMNSAESGETPVGSVISAEKHIKNAKDAIVRLEEFYEVQKETLADTLKTYIESSLTEAQRKLAEAEAKYATQEYATASDLAKESMHFAVKARNFSNMIENAGVMVDENTLEQMEELHGINSELKGQGEQRREGMKQEKESLREDLQKAREALREENKQENEVLREAQKKEQEAQGQGEEVEIEDNN
ncbi:MAG: hypothetical protein UT02_C0003G0009 [Parcubacteria group bacterium GW2011_GWC2_38_7]|nr:MAG: hypothetical protein UT02_C0003G0009 [Parcubacteria group bacterium GW2011_GWC2_38_7]